jgi:hypothetical protein
MRLVGHVAYMRKRGEMPTKFWSENLKGIYHLEGLWDSNIRMKLSEKV